MFADYFLSLLGTIGKEKRYAQHFRVGQYPLNPRLQNAIDQKKWFDAQYAIWVLGWSLALTWLVEAARLPEGFKQLLLGTLLVMFGILVANHLTNLLAFWYLSQHAGDRSAKDAMSQQRVLTIALYHIVLVMLAMMWIAISSRSNFARGGALGAALLFFHHFTWMRQARRAHITSEDRLR